jgi:ribosomal protein L40E
LYLLKIKDIGMSSQRQPGDWNCEKCNDMQFARNTHCRKCGNSRPGSGQDPIQPRDKFRPFKRGDWSCMKCGDHQFARNTACRRCGTPKNANGMTEEELRVMWKKWFDEQPKKYCFGCREKMVEDECVVEK